MKVIDIINKIFGTSDEKIIKKMRKDVEKINALEPSMEALTDAELGNKTNEFKERLAKGETLDDLLIEHRKFSFQLISLQFL